MSLPHRLPRVLGVNVGGLGACQGSREPPYALRWSSELTQSLSQRSHVAYALPHPPPRGDRLSGVPAVPVDLDDLTAHAAGDLGAEPDRCSAKAAADGARGTGYRRRPYFS
jgi:hypothetical protein